jgi:aminoglycoside 3-N-acetyltransferase
LLTGRLGIKKGMTVFVHSSMEKLNPGFPVYQVLNILLEEIGEEGTLLFPAWHYLGRAEDYLRNQANVFNVGKSPTVLGLLPELARRHPGAQRSFHPITSVVAIGKHAGELVSTHHLDIYPQGEKSPFYKMLEYDARIIGLGEKIVILSFIHCVEDVMKEKFPVKTLTDEIFPGSVIVPGNDMITVNTKAPHLNIQNRNIQGFFKKLISSDLCLQFRSRGVNYFTCAAKPLFTHLEQLANQSQTIYH